MTLPTDISALTRLLDDSTLSPERRAEILFERGKLYWREGNHTEAVADYAAARDLDSSSPAAVALQHASDIASFFNPDMFNP